MRSVGKMVITPTFTRIKDDGAWQQYKIDDFTIPLLMSFILRLLINEDGEIERAEYACPHPFTLVPPTLQRIPNPKDEITVEDGKVIMVRRAWGGREW